MTAGRVPRAVGIGAIPLAVLVGVLVGVVGPVPVLLMGAAAASVGIIAGLGARLAVAPRLGVVLVAAFAPTVASALTIMPGTVGRVLPVAVFSVALLVMTTSTSRADHRLTRIFGAYILLLCLALMRGWLNSARFTLTGAAASALLLLVMGLFAVRLFTTGDSRDRRLRTAAVCVSPAVYVLVNVFVLKFGAHIPGITLPEVQEGLAAGNPATMLVQLGFGGAERISYPLGAGVNAFGIVSAVGLVMATLAAWRNRGLKSRLFYGAASATCLYGVLTTDSRTALVMAVIVIVVGMLRYRPRYASRLAILVPLGPLVLVALLAALSGSGAATDLSRNGADFTTGTGRTVIWSGIWDHVVSNPSPALAIGWGANGQLTSGAWQTYAYLFRSQREQLYTAHDVYLQTLLDIGIVGLIFLVLAFSEAVVRLLRSAEETFPAFGWGLIAMMLAGITESTPSYQFPATLTLFVILIGAGVGAFGAPPTSTSASAPPGAPRAARPLRR